jgi:hypothetical protein
LGKCIKTAQFVIGSQLETAVCQLQTRFTRTFSLPGSFGWQALGLAKVTGISPQKAGLMTCEDSLVISRSSEVLRGPPRNPSKLKCETP